MSNEEHASVVYLPGASTTTGTVGPRPAGPVLDESELCELLRLPYTRSTRALIRKARKGARLKAIVIGRFVRYETSEALRFASSLQDPLYGTAREVRRGRA